MKLFLYFIFCCTMFSSCTAAAQQKQIFDIVTYTLPTGWQHSKKPETVTVSKEDKDGNFCFITIYKSVESGNDSKQNFDLSWEALVQNVLATGKATMQPAGTDNGWTSEIGSAPFEKDGIKGAAILISSTNNGKMVNIVVITNTNKYQKEMELFLDGITLKDTSISASTVNTRNQQPEPSAINNQKVEIWMRVQMKVAPGIQTAYYPFGALKPKFYVLYPNGDYYPHFPTNGMIALSNENKNESWGKFSISGSKGRFLSKYEDIAVQKVSPVEMKKQGYAFGFYKCVPVDGLRLNGQWGTFIGWEKDAVHGNPSGINGTAVRAVIEFKKEGSFIDYGAFVTNLLMPNQYADNAPGKGTYQIKNFTLTLQYDDGRIVYKAFTGTGNKDPRLFSKQIFIGTQPFFSK